MDLQPRRGLDDWERAVCHESGSPHDAYVHPVLHPWINAICLRPRFLGGIIMALLTSARFRGDTTFGFLTRIFSTFLGGGVGLCGEYTIIPIKGFYQLFVSLTPRYICAPTKGHQASPYVLGAIFAVCFPFFFYIRLYIPGPPMRILIFFVTTVKLAISYS
ncbi:hypothetical protein F5879DRAFT_462657 [Lentinula edodes]|nr:hypothetical protein F5879DRAFT_462657 [Lentinula edodes]